MRLLEDEVDMFISISNNSKFLVAWRAVRCKNGLLFSPPEITKLFVLGYLVYHQIIFRSHFNLDPWFLLKFGRVYSLLQVDLLYLQPFPALKCSNRTIIYDFYLHLFMCAESFESQPTFSPGLAKNQSYLCLLSWSIPLSSPHISKITFSCSKCIAVSYHYYLNYFEIVVDSIKLLILFSFLVWASLWWLVITVLRFYVLRCFCQFLEIFLKKGT